MDTTLQVVAWISMALTLLPILVAPLLLGKSRGEFDYPWFLSTIISGIMVWLLALKALGYL